MNSPENINDTLYSGFDLAKIINKYQQLIRFLKLRLGEDFVNKTLGTDNDDQIVDIKRWLVEWENRMFWDHLCAAHGVVEDEMKYGNLKWKFKINDGVGCTKLIFSSGKEFIFTREKPQKCPTWVISLDKFYDELVIFGWVDEFRNLSNEIYRIEVNHFNSPGYLDKKSKIVQSSRDDIIKNFNITEE